MANVDATQNNPPHPTQLLFKARHNRTKSPTQATTPPHPTQLLFEASLDHVFGLAHTENTTQFQQIECYEIAGAKKDGRVNIQATSRKRKTQRVNQNDDRGETGARSNRGSNDQEY